MVYIFLVFDPNEKPDENNFEYNKIHEQYKNLVNVCCQHGANTFL